MSKNTVLVPLLEGFEEIEAVTIIDVLRRANVPVVTAGVNAGPVQGSHGISVCADRALEEIEADDLAMIALPGGMPGAKNLSDNSTVQSLVKKVAADGGYTAAICAAPMALASAGVHKGHKVTSYPGFDKFMNDAQYVEDRVVVDHHVITSRGPGTALEFALTLVGLLRGPEVETDLQNKMLVRR